MQLFLRRIVTNKNLVTENLARHPLLKIFNAVMKVSDIFFDMMGLRMGVLIYIFILGFNDELIVNCSMVLTFGKIWMVYRCK